ncbi:scavenger receptor cysteine-rich type 1 protein M160 [Etheostoma spectabile]|uniref:scavenger receptor cysteine-rich type 1 protein M160 n=1 Tax=Etheostoma spectabile TaxID=54343 RepID=UPI0013AF1CD1|nr:scavenger receptor cysteine-rich type 1 protein M160-like [Etheostoma spectabile]
MMWFLLLLHTAFIEAVIAKGETRLILKNGSHPCEGYIEIYKNDKPGHVGEKYWSRNNLKVVCRSTHCGDPVSSTTVNSPWTSEPMWLNEVNCTGTEKHLWDCRHPGLGVSIHETGTRQKIECSNKITISLDGFECAGAVKYSTNGREKVSGYFCGDSGWGQEEADRLCQNLNCGKAKETSNDWRVWDKFRDSKKMTINCSNLKKIDNLWQCVTEESYSCQAPAAVMCAGHDQLRLKGNASNVCSGQLEEFKNDNWQKWNPVKNISSVWCEQMHCGKEASHSQVNNGIQLTCTDNVTVVLMDNDKRSNCYGEVHIQKNDENLAVCGNPWSEDNAKVVCKELNCGNVISYEAKTSHGTKIRIMDNVNCKGNEASLWHCRAKHYNSRVQCSSVAYIVCADSIKVNLLDGPGKCAGRVEIQHEGKFQRVNADGWTEANSDAVCKQLNCGSRRVLRTPEKFSHGSNDFLKKTVNCNPNAKHISECIGADSKNQAKDPVAVGITCEEHKVVFLTGKSSCSGMVGIEHRNKTYWLSGSKETWDQNSANTVCLQMHCGEASLPTSTPNADAMEVWSESYTCSSNDTSLLDCKNTTLPSNYSDTIATVTCTEKIEVNLTNECWGHVNVCANGECGDVCADTWTDHMSVMLCKNLGCGSGILDPKLNFKDSTRNSKVIFKGLHTTASTTSLSQSIFIKNDDNNYICNPRQAYVVCSGSVKSKFSSFRDKCSGNVLVKYEDQWLPVCKTALENTNTQKVICGEQCGTAGKTIPYFGPELTVDNVIEKIECEENAESITSCNVKTTSKKSCERGGLQCSNWRKMALTLGTACSGAVSVHSQNKISAVSTEGWTDREGKILCQNLECGQYVSNRTTKLETSLITSFSCAGVKNPENIWECEKQTKSKMQNQLFVECQDKPTVTLSDRCHGAVKINDVEVCVTNWKDEYSLKVCQEQNCGNAIAGASGGKQALANKKYYHVSCEGNHYKLGQCKRFQDKCQGKLVSIHCVYNVKFSTTQKCGGQIEVNYGLKREKVCPLNSFLDKHKDILCQKLGCGGHKKTVDKNTINSKPQAPEDMETSLTCTEDHLDISFCVHRKRCTKVHPAEIYCDEYDPEIKKTVQTPTSPMPIILAVTLSLVLVIVIVLVVRICVVKKAKKKAVNAASRKLSRAEVAFESGDYEDVKDNEMEALNRSRFESETKVITENDLQSTSSFHYDDIDDTPLTSQAATDINKGDPSESTDGVTYEVDDPQENYDDIEACPGITQTEAEVHNSTQTTPESDAEVPQGLVEGDDDYLVPGQDG